MFWSHLTGAMQSKTMRSNTTRSNLPRKRGAVKLLYYGYATVNVRGAATGHIYQFSRQHSLHAIDREDAASILHTGLFREVR